MSEVELSGTVHRINGQAIAKRGGFGGDTEKISVIVLEHRRRGQRCRHRRVH